ncbi:Enterochelin esterase [Amycolatopsis marina]|uniref:Acyl-CoA:diacylglycerol acyltransferase n=1 Tax=Amycolatopsis marina TaxID=490629 RepID=A0A1I0ZLT4_9PSEU|nr:alpha/beta hydrolase-fold protein [Amycolatopsis marina]SFB26759.1 Enterochelin esterase [Amycolatopsis marina]
MDDPVDRSSTMAEREPARPGHSRRSLLISGASALGVAGFATGVTTGTLPFGAAMQRALGVASPSPVTRLGHTRIERLFSPARGRMVDLVTTLPARSPQHGLPMVVFLHGLRGSARGALPGGLLQQLIGDIARRGVPPFGFVAVDGGNTYWHEHHRGDNPMAMLLDELPGWLRERGLAGTNGAPFACAGTSMGGFGALLYARRRAERRSPPAAIATLSAALLTSWAEMSKRHAFRDRADWASMDPLRNIAVTRGIPTGIWCGTEDRFIEGNRRFITLARPEIGYLAPGGHNGAFFRAAVPSLVRFLGRWVPAPA